MERVKSRFNKLGRTNKTVSNMNFDPSPSPSESPQIKKRSNTISEFGSDLLGDHDSAPVGAPHHLTYHGYMCLDNPMSSRDVISALHIVKEGSLANKDVSVSHSNGSLCVAEEKGSVILVCPLQSVATVVNDVAKGGNSDCLAISLGTGHYAKQCHAFQAKSSREAADIVQLIQKDVRNASKDRKFRKTDSNSSIQSKSKMPALDGPQASRPLFMEDEDEVIEHKGIASYGGRRDSKKTIPAIVRLSGEVGNSTSSLIASAQVAMSTDPSLHHHAHTASLPLKDKRKAGQRKSGGTRWGGGAGEQGEFTRQDKVEQLVGAIERIQENNTFLRNKAKQIRSPSNIFEDSLHAMSSLNYVLLGNYMNSESAANAHDSSGNNLLHYAVALGQVQSVRILCKHHSSLESSGWNDCKPIHRAIAEGHTPILQILLHHGADVNSLDLMRRTPLHFSSAQLELMECSISLLEFGAHVMVSDVLGLRPFDLNPELRETLNRLVTSACETFVSVPLKDGGKEASSCDTLDSLSRSPSSSPRHGSHDPWRPLPLGISGKDGDLNRLVSEVSVRARMIAHRSSNKRNKAAISASYQHSRSHGNLVGLQEEEEGEKMDRLKYPSDFDILSLTYQEMLENKEKVRDALRDLINEARKKGKRKEGASELETSLSEPHLNKIGGGGGGDLDGEGGVAEGVDSRPLSSMADLQRNRLMGLLGGHMRKFSADSGSSSGTLREGEEGEEEGGGDCNVSQLRREFDLLEEDLKRLSFRKSEDELNDDEGDVSRPHHGVPPRYQGNEEGTLRSREETEAIFNELISQMKEGEEGGGGEWRDGGEAPDTESQSNPNRNGIINGGVAHGGVAHEGEPYNIAKRNIEARRVQSSDATTIGGRGSDRPISSASLSKEGAKGGEDGSDHTPRAASVETEHVFATLPKKKKSRRKWSGIKRIGSPLFKPGRKSFTSHTPSSSHASSSSTHSPITGPSPSVPLATTHSNPTVSTVRDSKLHDHPSDSQTASKSSLTSLDSPVDPVRSESPRGGGGREGKVKGTISLVGVKRRGSGPQDECLNALKVMTTLSSNKECLGSLISYVCLPKSVTKFIEISQCPLTSPFVLDLISTLLNNLYQSGGAEGKKAALGSGVLDLTIKLLQSRDPIPGTCLALLNHLLLSDDDNEYLRTIIRIPTTPLLQYLEGFDPAGGGGGSDSGYENSQHRDTIISMETRSSSETLNTATDEGIGGGASGNGGGGSGTGAANNLRVPPRDSGERSASFTSETSEASSNGGQQPSGSPSSLLRPSHIHTHHPIFLDPRRIVLKMLAMSSTHSKMQLSLTTERAISLLSSCSSSDSSQENVTNSLITLANIALNVESHKLFHKLDVVKHLQSLLFMGPRPRYHACRALVYMGHLDLLCGCSVFDPVTMGYEPDIVIYTTDNDEHTYARGATVEKCIDLLTTDPSKLWGGFSLQVGPHPPHTDHAFPAPLHASKDQVIQFFLTTYKSFVHPLVFMRLLQHRLSSEDPLNLFDWSNKGVVATPTRTTHLVIIPATQISVLNLIGRWLEVCRGDFTDYPSLKDELNKILGRLKFARGPFIPHTHRLRSLLHDADSPRRTERVDQSVKEAESRPPHHDNLYRLCQQMVTGGHLPVNLHQAVFMATLQLHIEDISPCPPGVTPGTPIRSSKRGSTSKLKSAFPPGFTKSKNILKRIKTQLVEFENLSERNAKHLYIERCQANPGYNCSFFSVRVPSSGRFKRAPVAKQLMGINNKRIVFLDEKTKDLLASHSLQSVLSITRESDPCVLMVSIHGDGPGFKVQVDSAAVAKVIANTIEECREGEGMLDDTNLRWSESVSSLFSVSMDKEMGVAGGGDTESSISTADYTPSTERESASPGHMLSYEMLKNPSPDGGLVTTPPNGHADMLLSSHNKSDTLQALAHNDSTPSDVIGGDHMILSDQEKLLFCDCPPDPEISPELNLASIKLVGVLSSPLEIARQMTLIAHKRFGELTTIELLQKVNLLPKTSSHGHTPHAPPPSHRDSVVSTSTLRAASVEVVEVVETAVEKLAYRFNQVGNWVVHSVLQFEYLEERAEVIQQFIAIARHCFNLGNYSSLMAIVVAGLGSAPIRRLRHTWAQVSKVDLEFFKEMETILDSRGNYKHYRDRLSSTETPAVPYVGVFLKDLTFICDGNPDYLRGGLINMHKRRQVYRLLEEIHHYQKEHYKLHPVPELQQFLLDHTLVPEDDLHSASHDVEPRIRRSHSSSSTKSLSSNVHGGGRGFFRGLTRSGSNSSSYLNRTSTTSTTS